MIVDKDPERFTQAGFEFEERGATAVFRQAGLTASVSLNGDQLHFFPQRSTTHKAVLRALNLLPE